MRSAFGFYHFVLNIHLVMIFWIPIEPVDIATNGVAVKKDGVKPDNQGYQSKMLHFATSILSETNADNMLFLK
jgi:hypothetical protein